MLVVERRGPSDGRPPARRDTSLGGRGPYWPVGGRRKPSDSRHSPTNTVHLDNHYNKYHHHNINNNKPNNNLNNDLSGCGLLSLSRNNLLHFQVKHSSHSFKLPCNVVVKQWGI